MGFAAVYASSVLVQLVLCFWDHLFVVILDQKSPAAVRWLPPHRGRRSVEASLVELTLTQDTFVSRDELVVVSSRSTSLPRDSVILDIVGRAVQRRALLYSHTRHISQSR